MGMGTLALRTVVVAVIAFGWLGQGVGLGVGTWAVVSVPLC